MNLNPELQAIYNNGLALVSMIKFCAESNGEYVLKLESETETRAMIRTKCYRAVRVNLDSTFPTLRDINKTVSVVIKESKKLVNYARIYHRPRNPRAKPSLFYTLELD